MSNFLFSVYIVEKIVNHECAAKGQMRFLVRWKDWSPKYDTWEPEANLIMSSANCLLIMEYFDRKREYVKMAIHNVFTRRRCYLYHSANLTYRRWLVL